MPGGEISAPITEAIARLQYHAEAADPVRMLDGWRIISQPIREVEGQKDFPFVLVQVPNLTGDFRPTRHEDYSLQLILGVSVSKEEGVDGLFERVAKVLNALETTRDGRFNIDPGLSNSIMKPFSWTASQNFALDLSLNANITVTMQPRRGTRGLR